MRKKSPDGFDYTAAIDTLIRHIVANSPELSHVVPQHLLISVSRSRSPGAHGIYASIKPLRFKDGSPTLTYRGRTYSMPEIVHEGHRIMYIIYFSLPRFANLTFDDKIKTIFHELYHISPRFDGDIRRFPGPKYAHGHSRKKFNEKVEGIARNYLNAVGLDAPTSFLRFNFDRLQAEYGNVYGTRIRPPRPIRCP